MSEARKNFNAILLALLFVVLVGLFAYRPATVLGISGDALASSLGGWDVGERFGSRCDDLPSNKWHCKIAGGSSAEGFVVRTRAFGCWDAWRGHPPVGGRPPNRSGCISGFDLF
jgi:hypothetical protein